MTYFQWFAIPVALVWGGLFGGAAWLIMHRSGDFWFALMFLAVGSFPVIRLLFLQKVILEIDAAGQTFHYSSRVWWGLWNTTYAIDMATVTAVVYQKRIHALGADESNTTVKLLIRQQDGTDHTLFPYGIIGHHHESERHRAHIEWSPVGNGPLRLAKTGRTIAAALGVPYQEEESHW